MRKAWGKVYIMDNIDKERLQSEIKHYKEFEASKASIEKKSLGCYRINLTKNICSDGYKSQGRDVAILENISADAFFDFVYLRVEDKERIDEFKRIFNRENLIEEFNNNVDYIQFDHMYLKLINERKWVRSCINLIKNPYNGDIEGIIYVEDRTDTQRRKMMLDAIIKKQYAIMMCIDGMTGEYTIYMDKGTSDNEVYSGNDYHMALEKYSQARVCDECREEFIKTTNVDNILKHLKRPSSQYSKVFKIYDKDKNVTYQQLDFVYMDYNSKQILITYTDITKSLQKERETNAKLKKALKEVKKANEAKSEFLSRMSHDMRTPMNGIIGLTDILLADNTVTDTVRKKLLEMKEAEDLLLSLVNDILDMQKIESNKFVLSNHFYPFIDIIKNIHMCILPQINSKNITFNISYKDIKQCNIYVDKLRISQVFINILSNSIKFTPEGDTINCYIKKLKQENDIVDIEVTISDNGIGMSQEFLEHIFEPFEQEESDFSTAFTGTGLGMAIVRNIIELMNGNIDIKSCKGVGTTTVVKLSFKISDEKKEKSSNKLSNHTSINLEGKKVLLCEDNELNIKVAESMLKERKMEVVKATNGQEAIEIFTNSNSGTFDIILMDIRMPVINGLKASSAIRQLDRADAMTIPIVALTANAYDQEVEVCRQAGMNAHIAKPINIGVFYSVIENELAKAQNNIN